LCARRIPALPRHRSSRAKRSWGKLPMSFYRVVNRIRSIDAAATWRFP
jgi:hypothetical protein